MTRLFLKHPIAVWVLFIALVILGVYALPKLRIESMPEVELPSLTIQTYWTGASPVAVQRAITVPVEEAVRRVRGIEKVIARSYPGMSLVEVSFRRDINVEYARLELGEQLSGVRRSLPLNARPPEVRGDVPEEFSTREFFSVSLISPLDPNELRERAEKWIVPQILAVEGVASAEVRGGADRLLRIVLDREKLRMLRISADAALRTIGSLDDVLAGGVVRQGAEEAWVSIRSEANLSELADLVVARRGERLIRLGEVAEIRWDHEDPVYLVRVNGENLVQLSIEKRRGMNAVTVSRRIRALLPRLEGTLPFAVKLEVDEDGGGELEHKLVELGYRSAVILAILVLLLLLSMRNFALAGSVTASILLAVAMSLSFFYFLGVSVNFITISGLTVCFGMILDNSILIVDGVQRQLVALRRGRSRAAGGPLLNVIDGGVREVTPSIMGSTLTTMVAFLSFVFLSGRLALYYMPLAVAVVTAMGVSVFVALGWMPVVLSALARRSGLWRQAQREPSARELEADLALGAVARAGGAADGVAEAKSPPRIERCLAFTLRCWWLVLLIAAASLAGAAYIYAKKIDRGGFWRAPEKETLYLGIRLPEGTDVQVTYETLKRFEREILPVPTGVRARSQVWRNQGQLVINFEGETLYSELPLLYRSRLIDLAEKMAGMGIYLSGFSDQAYFKGFFAGMNLNSTIKISGYNSQVLDKLAQRVLRQAERSRRVRQARTLNDLRSVLAAQNESIVSLRREPLKEFGLTAAEAVAFLRRLVGMDYPMPLVVDGEAERVQLSYDDADEIEFDELAQQVQPTAQGRSVRLGDVFSLETVPLAGPVVREDQRYTKYVTWEYIGTDAMRTRYLRQVLDGLHLPYGYTAEETEQTFLTEEEETELGLMLVLALAFIYMILAALFESLLLPLLVMLAVPLSLIGVFGIFWATGSTFDSSARIGLVLLFGVVVNNAILLVARYRHEVRERLGLEGDAGEGPAPVPAAGAGDAEIRGAFDLWRWPSRERLALLRDAVCHGTHVRLRSVLLTTGTTIVGLAPLLVRFEKLEGKDIWENLALSSIGGLTAGTILTLLVIPTGYYLAVRSGWWLHAWPARLRGKRAT